MYIITCDGDMYKHALIVIVLLGSFMLYLTINGGKAYNTNHDSDITKATYELLQAIDMGDDYGVIDSIESGADVNFITKSGDTPLHKSVLTKNSTITKLLIKNHADPNIKNSNNKTAFDIAFRINSHKMTDILKEYKNVK